MSAARVRTAVVIGCLSGFVLGCDEDTVTGDRDAATQLSVNPSFTIVDAADTSRIQVVARNRAGEATFDPVQFTACDTKIVAVEDPTRLEFEPPTRILVIGQTLGASCVDVTGPGSLTATATVNVVPAAIALSLPADTIQSGETAQATLTYLDAADLPVSGFDLTQVEFSILTPAIADVDAAALVAAKSPGTTFIKAALVSSWGAPRVDSIPFTVVPGPFGGGFAPASGSWGDTVTITAAPGPAFDDDTGVEFDGLLPFPISSSTSEIVVVAPAGITTAEMVVLNVGANQLAFADTFVVTDPNPMDGNEPNNAGGGGGGSLSNPSESTLALVPFEQYISVGSGDLDDVFQLVFAVQTTVNFSLDWNFPDDVDLDILFYDGAGTLLEDPPVAGAFGCATADVPETCSVTFDPGTYYIDVNVFDDGGHAWTTALFTMQ